MHLNVKCACVGCHLQHYNFFGKTSFVVITELCVCMHVGGSSRLLSRFLYCCLNKCLTFCVSGCISPCVGSVCVYTCET